jgi:2-polyprenyl-6-methoxyphenol hydroxylase-like FAD-dependent oxidoreductase
MHADSPDDKSQWEMFWVKVWRRDGLPVPEDTHGQKALEYLKTTTKNWVEPYNTLVQSTPDNADVHIDHMRVWTSKPFDNLGGRVTLAGDAGHPMLPYRGQGFQHAILDATKILDALLEIRDEGAPASEVITEYDKDMVERGAKAVQQSIKEAELSMDLKTVNQMLMVRKGHIKDAE